MKFVQKSQRAASALRWNCSKKKTEAGMFVRTSAWVWCAQLTIVSPWTKWIDMNQKKLTCLLKVACVQVLRKAKVFVLATGLKAQSYLAVRLVSMKTGGARHELTRRQSLTALAVLRIGEPNYFMFLQMHTLMHLWVILGKSSLKLALTEEKKYINEVKSHFLSGIKTKPPTILF